MLDGWYCRSMANQEQSGSDVAPEQHQQHENDDDLEAGADGAVGVMDSGSDDESQMRMPHVDDQRIDYRAQYSGLKKKLKFLLYENEFFQDALRSSQRRLLKVTRDRSFLLDRLVQYEKPEATTSESEDTESSDDEGIREAKRRKIESTSGPLPPPAVAAPMGIQEPPNVQIVVKPPVMKRKKQSAKKALNNPMVGDSSTTIHSDGHMTAEEVERHLQSRQILMELVPERAPPTVPNEMFSNEPSLDSESNDQMVDTSPSHIGDEF